MTRAPHSALILTFVLLLVTTGPTRPVAQDLPETSRIVTHALERAAWAEEQNFPGRFRYQMTRRVRRFDGDGHVKRDETREFEIEPVHGVPFASLLSRDEQPLTETELAAEQKRKQQFAKTIENGEYREEEEDDEIVFNEELVGRYTFQPEGMENLRGRSTYRLLFQPRAGRLPVRRHLDQVLNNAEGVLWVDQATFEVARVEFVLIDKVRMWWGVLGAISHAHGSYDRYPVEEEIWAPLQQDTFFDARILFSFSRREEVSKWRNFEMIPDTFVETPR